MNNGNNNQKGMLYLQKLNKQVQQLKTYNYENLQKKLKRNE